MKRLLIISPRFAPVNAADMQRVRMSLPYFETSGWQADVVCVDERYVDMDRDPLLLHSIADHVNIYKVSALNKKWTSKIGLGSLGLRSLRYFRKKVNELLTKSHYDLIYFSTTEYSVCVLGPYWKKKFGVPYVIDMQDPWHSTYYQDKPKNQRPPKYWFSYRLNKYLEPKAVKKADGLISVSNGYIDTLKQRYTEIKDIPAATIPFGSFKPDMDIAKANHDAFPQLLLPDSINMVYVGRGGKDMHKAITPLLIALQLCLKNNPAQFKSLRLYFIGTSYAPAGTGMATVLPLAKKYGVEQHVVEITDRISYYHTLNILNDADALFMPGSDDPHYSASKIYPYVLTGKPILSIVNDGSSLSKIMNEYNMDNVYGFTEPGLEENIISFLTKLAGKELSPAIYNVAALNKYDAANTTKLQCTLFNQVLNGVN